ncbi:MAG: tRNA (adenosine(37)-N6)-threonylcarbamoyltransferase complex dimerization subunit type 1 TsaB [Actinobacteria bacterium]|nr:tRNA (adenosine(37)-N6)-threonylcarbamoyltransferase complex dimerization subunit type 1 TsaB [Actinomycetota bacterium]
MKLLALKTDVPEAELILLDEGSIIARHSWQAHRQLSDTIHHKVDEFLHEEQSSFADIDGLIIYKGPGSFTGIRIGFAYMQALAMAFQLPLVGTNGEAWLASGAEQLRQGKQPASVTPEYGSAARTTTPKK